MRHPARLAAHGRLATALALPSDRRLAELVAAAEPAGTGVGGRSAHLEVDGARVFVKRVPLTDLELEPAHLRSTANLFGLPTCYQYGLGSAGFGVWRELATHVMTTHWVLAGAYEGFPLLHHWRVLPDTPPAGVLDVLGGIDATVAHWDGDPAVRRRLEAIGAARHSLVLFLEHQPHTLAAWLDGHPDRNGAPHRWAERELARGTAFMAAHGLVHFDTHLRNVLTDGRTLYFADFGLALSERFELAPEERDFLAAHRPYDRHHATGHLLRQHLVDAYRGERGRIDFLRDWTAGHRPPGVPPQVAAILDRNAPAALVLDGFHHRLTTESKRTPYPAAALDRAAAAAGALVNP